MSSGAPGRVPPVRMRRRRLASGGGVARGSAASAVGGRVGGSVAAAVPGRLGASTATDGRWRSAATAGERARRAEAGQRRGRRRWRPKRKGRRRGWGWARRAAWRGPRQRRGGSRSRGKEEEEAAFEKAGPVTGSARHDYKRADVTHLGPFLGLSLKPQAGTARPV
ncbi:hypothetical protein BRADI_2g42862v3 [Brachypodium distachyon]|uniref:Uncharacterized protein n=1 Tax=Brachypodium distachyon TaxID=15368 RepID=A0A2K2DDG8_BRADI|nr:hypothetical protein BRADI_2g42862v3 [Brachypodium distachyon]